MKNYVAKHLRYLILPRKRAFLRAAFLCVAVLVSAETNTNIRQKILEKLPLCRDSKTGAVGADGNYTRGLRKGFNCSGFAKWIVDGFYAPLSNSDERKYISLVDVRKKHIEKRGCSYTLIYEQSRDPYFGLDWTRNLAVELGRKRGEIVSCNSCDVVDSKVCEYIKDCGYPLSTIEDVLREQAAKFPNKIYLGSINGFFGERPKLWQHYHIAVFIPYYEAGELKIAVLERNKETSFEYLQRRYPNTFCHLVAIENNGKFELMTP